MQFYASPRLYLQDSADLQDKICRIDAIILATMDAMLAQAAGEDTLEYRLDDGQTKINVTSRSLEEMAGSIRALERLQQMYANRFNGRVVRLVDHNINRFLRTYGY